MGLGLPAAEDTDSATRLPFGRPDPGGGPTAVPKMRRNTALMAFLSDDTPESA